MPPRSIPTPDSVVYNNSMFDRNTQENRVFTRFLVPLQQNFVHLSQCAFVVSVVFFCIMKKMTWFQRTTDAERKWMSHIQTLEMGGKSISVFPGAKLDSPIIYLNTFSGEEQNKGGKSTRPRRLPAARRSRWWPSVTWTGTTTWCPGTVRLLSNMPILSPAARTTICGC